LETNLTENGQKTPKIHFSYALGSNSYATTTSSSPLSMKKGQNQPILHLRTTKKLFGVNLRKNIFARFLPFLANLAMK